MLVDLPTFAYLGLIAFAIFTFIVYIGSTAAGQRKLEFLPVATLHFVASQDMWGKKAREDSEILLKREVRRKKIYFIRHAESAWNVLFNRGFGWGFLPNLISALAEEFMMLPTGESLLLDSPLSIGGISQAMQLRDWLQSVLEDPHGEFLRSSGPEQIALCSSNMRRAVSTAVIGLGGRLLKNKSEKVHVLSSLQEVTRNIDGVSLSAAGSGPSASPLEKSLPELEPVVEGVFRAGKVEGSQNFGTKPFLGRNAYTRFDSFCDWCFNSDAAKSKSRVAATGHSLYFKEFMKLYLPKSTVHIVKTMKMVNCGVLSFDLVDCGEGQYAVDPHSLLSVYGGFEGVKEFEMKNK